MAGRRFPPPWTVDQSRRTRFVLRGANGQALGLTSDAANSIFLIESAAWLGRFLQSGDVKSAKWGQPAVRHTLGLAKSMRCDTQFMRADSARIGVAIWK
jgi:hypothetical protein